MNKKYLAILSICAIIFPVTIVADYDDNDEPSTINGAKYYSINNQEVTTARYLDNGDVDMFKVYCSKEGVLEFSTSGKTATFGALLNNKGEIIATDNNSGSGRNFAIAHAVTPGTYYLRISGDSGIRTDDRYDLTRAFYPYYELRANVSGYDNNGYGNKLDRAVNIYPQNKHVVVKGRIDYKGDVDYYRIPRQYVNQADGIMFYTTGSTDTYGTFYGPYTRNGRVTRYNDDGGIRTNFKLGHTGSYDYKSIDCFDGECFIKVQHYDDGTGAYDLHIVPVLISY